MSTTFYLGTAPSSSQKVSSDLQSRGISLLKAAPCDIKPLVLSNAPASYGVYKTGLSSYVRAAETDTAVLMSDPYHLFRNRMVPDFMADPEIIWSFTSPPTAEVRDRMKKLFDARDSVAKGQANLTAQMTLSEVQQLIKEYSPIQTTPASSSAMNIAAYKQFVLLHRLFDTVVRTHQYAFNMKEFDTKLLEVDSGSLEKIDHMGIDAAAGKPRSQLYKSG
jgi:hypothetical protein